MNRYASLPPLPARISRLARTRHRPVVDLAPGARGVPAPGLPALADDRAQPGAHAVDRSALDARAGCGRTRSFSRSTIAPSTPSTPRGRRETPGGRARVPHLDRPVDRLLLRRVRAPSVAADLRGRSRRARRRSLQGSVGPRRAARRRRVHVSAGLLPPAPVGRGLAGRELRAPELGRRADRRRDDAGRQAVHHRRAARRPIGARRPSGASASAASRSTCSTPISKRTRPGTASSRRACTAAIARRASSRKSCSASAACARSRRSASSRRRFTSTKDTPGSSSCSASTISSSTGASFDDALEEIRRSTIFTTHTPVPAGHDAFPFDLVEEASGRLLGHARRHTATSSSRSARTTTARVRSST